MATNGWSKETERLLRNWSKQISINESEFRKRGSYYRNWYYGFGAFIIITQTGALTTLVNLIIVVANSESSEDVTGSALAILVFIAALEMFILVAQGLDKFFNFGSGSQQFYEAAKNHDALSRLIDSTLMLPRVDRDVAREVLLSIREHFDRIQDESPNLPPNAIIHKLDMCIYEDPTQARGIGAKSDSPVLEDTMAIDLPGSPPDEIHDHDEEYVSNVNRVRINTQLQENKQQARIDQRKSMRMRNMEYQWGRMHQYEEDETESSEYSA